MVCLDFHCCGCGWIGGFGVGICEDVVIVWMIG